MEEKDVYTFFVGTYTDSGSKGIYKYLLKSDGSLKQIGLAAKSENPSFLTMSADKKFLIAINEINNDGVGTVESFSIKNDSLKFISRSSSGGAHPCFVTINEDGYILTANYTGGNIGLLKLNNNGSLSGLLDLQQHTGSGGTERQKAPHAHSVWFEPNSTNIISIDLGTNELLFSQLNTQSGKLVPLDQYKLKMEYGAGPRHLVFHPNNKWIYVVNELNSTVTLLRKSDEGKYESSISVSTLPAGYTKPNTCADIHISSDGMFLYASNRGENSIAIFKVNTLNGSLNLIAHESTRGDGPRNFSLSPDEKHLLVANQHTKNIVSFKRNSITGLLNYIDEVEAPTPVCILF
ncbi:MAG: lactonase family protein [Melioribacteraceae bacterium]|nr:lactonase family protein [Melioribacteraceae bacterium]